MRLSGRLAAFVFGCLLGITGNRPVLAANACLTAASDTQDLRKDNKLREARLAAVTCSRPACNSVVRASCEKWLREIDEEQPSLIVHPVDSRGRDVVGAKVTIDESAVELDGAPVPLDPGPHLVRARARSGELAEQKILVVLKEKARVVELRFAVALQQDGSRAKEDEAVKPHDDVTDKDPAMTAPPASSGERNVVLPLALAGVGVVALGAFAYFLAGTYSAHDDLDQLCNRPPGCSRQQLDAGKREGQDNAVAASVALGVAGVTLGVAALVYFTSAGASTTKPAPPTRGSALDLARGMIRF